jgi:hypothetical protein
MKSTARHMTARPGSLRNEFPGSEHRAKVDSESGERDRRLIVISARHGQSPVDSSRYTPITASGLVTTSPATILSAGTCLPYSESPANPTGVGPTEDDVSLIWLSNSCAPLRVL